MRSLIPSKVKDLYRKLFWLSNNHARIADFEKLKEGIYNGAITYAADGLVTSANCDFMDDPRFREAYRVAAATNPWPGFTSQWRVYLFCWFAQHASRLPGDFVECGVNTGAYARAAIEYMQFRNLDKSFYLLDTFEGFDTTQLTPEEVRQGLLKYGEAYGDVYEKVLDTFQDFRVQVIKGRVPDTLGQCRSREVCFLSIDMNAVVPELAAAEYFWPYMVPGAVILLDDYGFPGHIHQKQAFDRFAAGYGLTVMALPTGQGVIIK